jgi:ABC-type multidrug transport system ATPase subunit
MTKPPVVQLRGVRKTYGKLVAVDLLDLEVQPGDCVALIGHNGSGKTTTLRLVAGLLEPTDGEVTVVGDNLRLDRSRAALSFVPDTPLLYPDLTVREHLELVGLANGVGNGLDGHVADLLDLTTRADFLPGQLSRGMRQKTQLACALVRPFQVILLDEPVVGLDPPSQRALHRVLLAAKQHGAAILLSTHQLAFATGVADRAVVLHECRMVEQGAYGSVVDGAEAGRLGCGEPGLRGDACVPAPPPAGAPLAPAALRSGSPACTRSGCTPRSAPGSASRRCGRARPAAGRRPGWPAAGSPAPARWRCCSGCWRRCATPPGRAQWYSARRRCTGVFTREEDLKKHVQAGASYVILSAPTKSETVPTVVHGVNRPDGEPQLISCASCTTNCITPVIEIAHRRIGVERAVMTTVHAYTGGQQLVDGPSKSFRRGRAGAANLVPTSTGAAQATTRAVPELGGRFGGVAVRAPIPVGSIADIVFVAGRSTTAEEINEAYRQEAATARYQGILGVSEDPLVSPTSSATRAPRSWTST